MIISLVVAGVAAVVVGGTVAVNEVKNKKYDESELTKTDENTLQQFDESTFSEEQKADFEENAEMSVGDYQKIIAQMQEEIKAKKSEFNASKKGRGLLGTIGDGFKSLFGGGSKKVKNEISSAEEQLNALIAKGDDVTLAEIEEVYKTVMGTDLDLAAVKATMNSTDGNYTVQQQNPDGSVTEVTYSKEDIVQKIQENAKRLQEKFDKTKSDQGILSKGLGCVNNFLGIGTTGNQAQAQITAFIELANSISASDDDATFAAKFKSITGNDLTEQAISQLMFDVDAYIAEYEAEAATPLTELEKEQIKDYYTMMGNNPANEAIMDYESTQESIKEGFNTIVTTVVVIAAVAAAPFSGGTSLAAVAGCVALGAGVGAATNVALNATDGLTSADGYSLEEAKMDALEGGVNGALAGYGAGAAKAAAGAAKAATTASKAANLGSKVVKGAKMGAAYGSISSAANYTIDTKIKNELIEGELVQNLRYEYVDEQGRNCIQYPVIDKNGDILYYETHVFDANGQYLEKFTSNDFSLGGLLTNTASGAVTGAVAGGVAGGAGFKLGKTDGSTIQRLAQGTATGAAAGAAGGAAGGATNWALNGCEGGASGLSDAMVDGTLEGATTGAVAGFGAAGGQIIGEKASPKVLNHIEKKYENAQARKLAADAKAPKVEGDPDGPDAPKTKAQQRADKRVAKYQKQFETQAENVKNYGYEDLADDAIQKKADFDNRLANGEVDPIETRYDKVRAAGDDILSKTKAKNAEILDGAKTKGGKILDKITKTSTGEKRTISGTIKEGYEAAKGKYHTAKDSVKSTWETLKAEKGLWNKGKALYGIGKDAAGKTLSKIFSRFTKSGATAAASTAATDTPEPTKTTTTSTTPKMTDAAARSLERIAGRNKFLADKLAAANISDSALAKIEQILKANPGKTVEVTTVSSAEVRFNIAGNTYDVAGSKVLMNRVEYGSSTDISGIWKDYDGSFDT